jgi:hypothetical protein
MQDFSCKMGKSAMMGISPPMMGVIRAAPSNSTSNVDSHRAKNQSVRGIMNAGMDCRKQPT